MSHALEMYSKPADYPDVRVPQYAIKCAVQVLPFVNALRLIRAAYQDADGGLALLADAREIYTSIMAEYTEFTLVAVNVGRADDR